MAVQPELVRRVMLTHFIMDKDGGGEFTSSQSCLVRDDNPLIRYLLEHNLRRIYIPTFESDFKDIYDELGIEETTDSEESDEEPDDGEEPDDDDESDDDGEDGEIVTNIEVYRKVALAVNLNDRYNLKHACFIGKNYREWVHIVDEIYVESSISDSYAYQTCVLDKLCTHIMALDQANVQKLWQIVRNSVV